MQRQERLVSAPDDLRQSDFAVISAHVSVIARHSLNFPNEIEVMFEGPDYPKPLDEELFNRWLENGRGSKIGYNYLLIVWDDFESAYQPVYLSKRHEIKAYKTSTSRERFIAAYDLYSESRIS